MQTKRLAETKSLLQWEKVPRNEADEVFLGKTTIFDTSSLAPWCDDFFPLEKAWCTANRLLTQPNATIKNTSFSPLRHAKA